MKSIQIGRDINVAWSILEKGAPYNLEGLKTNLYLKDMYGKSPIAFSVEGNVLFWTFRGADQKHTGKYSLELVINEGENNMVTTDARNFVNLVFHDCSNEEGYEIDSLEPCNHDPEVEISSELGYVAMIVDTELSETSENAVSNKAVVAGLNSITSDWEASANEKGYIKNKPFGEIYNKLEWYYYDSADGVLCDTVVDKVFIDGKEYDLTLGEILNIDNTNFGIGIDEYYNKVKIYGAREDDVDWITNNVLTGGVIKTIDELYIPNTIARTNGYYQSVTVGYSDNLVGRGESTPEMFSFRASGGRSINDGAARIKTLRGNAVVLNQHLPNNGNWRVQDGTLTMENNAYVVKPTGGYPGIATPLQSAIRVGNKIAVAYDYYTQGASDAYVNIGGNNSRISNVEQGAWKTIVHIIPCEKWNEAVGCVVFGGGAASVIKFKDIRCYDLTRMFGQGNEPTTADAFNAMLPLNVDLTAYNEGEVIPFNGVAIKSVGDNAWDGLREMGDISGSTGEEFDSNSVWRTADYIRILPNAEYCVEYTSSAFLRARFYDKDRNFIGIVSADNTDIYTNKTFTAQYNAYYIRFAPNLSVIPYDSELCVRLVHSGWKQDTGAPFEPYKEFVRNIDTRILEMFPDGMNKWDKAYNKNGRGYVVKGTGVVDLGTLAWRASGSNGSAKIWNSPIGFPSAVKANNVIGNILTAEYITATGDEVYLLNTDKSIALAYTAGGNYLSVYNNAFVNAEDETAFVESMQGVMLYYELAEPQVYEFAEPFNLDYEVADFGTEEVLASKPSAPISADIIYQFNAVDSIRDLLARIAALESKIK